ncbi:hypothetical protein Tco_0981060 [Tanacetum coccineum]
MWNLKVKGNDVPSYTERFQELTLICTKFVANETKKVDKYISGLPDNIYGNIKSARPKTLDETIELANELMDQKLSTYAERQSDNKRKADDSSRNNHGHQQQPFKRQNVAKKGNGAAHKGNGCFECGAPRHFKRDFGVRSYPNLGERYDGVEVCETFYAYSDSLLLTPLCCDDIHDVTPRVSTLAGCDRLVSEPLVIEK